jgi:hypothetical protein
MGLNKFRFLPHLLAFNSAIECPCLTTALFQCFNNCFYIHNVPEVSAQRGPRLFGQTRKPLKREMLQVTYFQYQVLDFFLIQGGASQQYTLYISVIKKLRRSCQGDMMAKRGYMFRVKRSAGPAWIGIGN